MNGVREWLQANHPSLLPPDKALVPLPSFLELLVFTDQAASLRADA
jgi:hypothetical protein